MVPNKEKIMPVLMKLLSDGNEHCFDEAEEKLAKEFKLSKQDLEERISSGYRTRFMSNIAWAVTALVQQKRIERTGRGCFKAGKNIGVMPKPIPAEPSDKLPEEAIEDIHEQLNMKLVQELLAEVKKASPEFLERLVLDLLQKMGYGGKIKAAGTVTGKTGDEGIDGVIREDALGLDIICYQAKRYEGPVPFKEVRDFAGSLGKKTNKGIFVTTSTFSSDAYQWIKTTADKKIIPIDGEKLAQLMIEHGVGVTVSKTYRICDVDSNYFNERN